MKIYIDENMSPYLAKGFNELQKPLNINPEHAIDVCSIKEAFGRGAKDEDWISQAGQKGACIITQDYNIKRTRHQQVLCEDYNLGVFYFRPPSKAGFKYWEMLSLMVKHWLSIVKIAATKERPFAYKVSSRGKLEEL